MSNFDVLDNLRYRGFTDELLALFNPAIGDETATFYLYNLCGQIVGYQQYRPDATKTKSNHPTDSRYFTYCRKSTELNTIGGLETYHFSDVLYVVEGIFDAVRLWSRGLACVFTLGAPDRQVQHWLRVQQKPTIGILDPLTHPNQKAIRRDFKRCCDLLIDPEQLNIHCDLGDMTEEQVNRILS